jgi:N-carbamoyl-L-amino-acid hydrolase
MRLRHDAAYVAAAAAVAVRRIVAEAGEPAVGTVGRLRLHPDLVNVVAATATLTIDLRHTDGAVLAELEAAITAAVDDIAASEGASIRRRSLARFEPVVFDDHVVDAVESAARRRGHDVMRMPSGAGHDAQMIARLCPAGMVFVPSVRGISHNPAEFTEPAHLAAGAQVLADVLLELAGTS